MDYVSHYNRLIERAPKEKPLDYYTEGHHVVPKCIGGTNADGIVFLKPEEHYIAHLLLVKIHPNTPSLIYAANMMTVSKDGLRVNNKKYSWLRKRHAMVVSKTKRGIKHSAEHRRKNSEAKKRQIQTIETRLKRSKALKGIPRSAETRAKISKAQKGRPLTEKQRLACEARKGISLSEEVRRKISEANKGKKLTSEQCTARRKSRGPMSDEQRKAISISRKGQPSSNKGKKLSDEHRRKLSESNKIAYAKRTLSSLNI
jgi:NUMOD3 motif